MTTHKHNPVIKGLYILGVIAMFVFFTLLVRHSAAIAGLDIRHVDEPVYSQSSNKDEVAPFDNKETQTEQKPSDINKPVREQSEGLALEGFYLIGKAYNLDLSRNLVGQFEQIWNDFFATGLREQLGAHIEQNTVYQTYDLDPQSYQAKVVLGFAAADRLSVSGAYQRIRFPDGEYWSTDTVLSAWENASSLPAKVDIALNFERFEMDEQYQVLSQAAYLRVLPKE